MSNIYLASPFFNRKECEIYQQVIAFLRKTGNNVYVPQEHSIPNAWDLSNPAWGKAVFDEDVQALRECDEVYCINWGLYSDSGTAWEAGFAYALGKPVTMVLVPTNREYGLMMVNGCNEMVAIADGELHPCDAGFIEQK